VLWNGGVDDAGRSRGFSADQVPDQPPGTILCESIYRFKGLERDVVVLVEIRPDDERLERLLYVGATRAKHHLVVIAPPALARSLR
jgi:superfamily I DNA/RNA helicase